MVGYNLTLLWFPLELVCIFEQVILKPHFGVRVFSFSFSFSFFFFFYIYIYIFYFILFYFILRSLLEVRIGF
ncbi:MAG: hypothetical protein N7Q72_04590, partial [Spiroplasma sp. Tabriz.8]|nr:hypothetical protein [Spiroplasma sp. Tabriz.8]